MSNLEWHQNECESDWETADCKWNQKTPSAQVAEIKFPTWKACITLNYNLFQYAEKGSQDLQKLKLKQEKLKLRQLNVGIQKEVETAVRNFNNQKVIISSLKKSLEAESFKEISPYILRYSQSISHLIIPAVKWQQLSISATTGPIWVKLCRP